MPNKAKPRLRPVHKPLSGLQWVLRGPQLLRSRVYAPYSVRNLQWKGAVREVKI